MDGPIAQKGLAAMSSQQKNEPTRVAVLGLGDMGVKHAEILGRLPGAEVVAALDTRSEVVAAYAEEHGVMPFTSMDDLVQAVTRGKLGLDAVDVCVPNAFHADLTVAALGLGLDVFCEKPVADTLTNANRIAVASDLSKGHVMFGFLYRYHPVVRTWMHEVARDLGTLVKAEVSVMRRDGIPGRPAFLNRRVTGGGPAVDLLPHALAVLVELLGMARPTEVIGMTVPTLSTTGDDVEDAAFATYVFGNGGDMVERGAQLTAETSWRANLPADEPDERWTIRLIGTEDGFSIELPTGAEAAQAGYEEELALFIARTHGAQPWAGDEMEQGLLVQEMIERLYGSARTGGRTVRFG